MSARSRRAWLEALGPFLGLAIVVVLFTVLEPDFLRLANIRGIASNAVLVAIAALGATVVIIAGGIDLSVGSVMALSAVVSAVAIRADWPVGLAAPLGVVAGAACGLVSGLFVTRLRIVPFIATLGMLGMARGLAKYLADQKSVDVDVGFLGPMMYSKPPKDWLLPPEVWLVSPSVWLTLLLAVGVAWMLRYTRFGVHVYAIGSSESTARLCGVPVDRQKLAIYALGGGFSGMAGVLLLGDLGGGTPTSAVGKELEVIAAVVIGGGSLAGGEGRIVGTVIGALIMAALANGCVMMGVKDYAREMLIGAIIVGAVALDAARRRAN